MTRKEALDTVTAAADTFYNCVLDPKDTESIAKLESAFVIVKKLRERLDRKR